MKICKNLVKERISVLRFKGDEIYKGLVKISQELCVK